METLVAVLYKCSHRMSWARDGNARNASGRWSRPSALSVSESPDRAGAYVLSFNPPDNLRDGKAHRADVKFKSADGKWKTLPLNWRPTFEKPKERRLN
jgi:hypothetical protein